jgi:hypothetical protein
MVEARLVCPKIRSVQTPTSEQYKAAFEEGMSLEEIAEAFGVPKQTIALALAKGGAEKVGALAQRAKGLADGGFSFSKIKKQLSVSTPELEALLSPWYVITRAEKGARRTRKRRLVRR